MLARWRQLCDRVDILSLRERIMILVGVLAVVAGLWEAMLAAPLEAREKRALTKFDSIKERLQRLDDTVVATADGMTTDLPDQLSRLKVLQARLAETDESLRVYTSDLVSPPQMRHALKDLVEKNRALKLVSIRNVEPEALIDYGEESPADTPNLYQHGLELVFEGPYLDCLDYLREVEAMPWQFLWRRLEVDGRDYPANRITIELSTLSLNEEWIGV